MVEESGGSCVGRGGGGICDKVGQWRNGQVAEGFYSPLEGTSQQLPANRFPFAYTSIAPTTSDRHNETLALRFERRRRCHLVHQRSIRAKNKTRCARPRVIAKGRGAGVERGEAEA